MSHVFDKTQKDIIIITVKVQNPTRYYFFY